ncbi:hypothetical protein R2A130_2177 [Ahrensia sp. R2A130]|nr:hypothetical protein R2A130_2177 [Ahrensia sp. R2A130]
MMLSSFLLVASSLAGYTNVSAIAMFLIKAMSYLMPVALVFFILGSFFRLIRGQT